MLLTLKIHLFFLNNSKIKPILKVKGKILKMDYKKNTKSYLKKMRYFKNNILRRLKKKIINYPHYLIQ